MLLVCSSYLWILHLLPLEKHFWCQLHLVPVLVCLLLQVLPSATAAELEGLMEGLLLLEVQVRGST
jgi:hypothetical protein